jgi:wyosine [tRNA(Phe)-imidazoG37] synthetase (radical SAM superfamily)
VADHRRRWRGFRYVYPVLSRRSGGLSIGVNLNPDQHCTFSCLYCQVDRRDRRAGLKVDLEALARELDAALGEAVSGRIWSQGRLAAAPAPMRHLRDIAFSGDGEPTCVPQLDRAVEIAAEARGRYDLTELKLVLLTNASRVNDEAFRRARTLLDANNGEIWAKLDAGTEAHFRRINRPHPSVRLDDIVGNILALAVARPIVIQTLLCRLDGAPPPPAEIDAYIRRLRHLLASGGRIKLVQLHTVARPPAADRVTTLADDELDALADRVRRAVAPVPVKAYYGLDIPTAR